MAGDAVFVLSSDESKKPVSLTPGVNDVMNEIRIADIRIAAR